MKVGSGEYTYKLIEDFAKLPEGQSFGLISRVTADAEDRLYVFQRKDPAVLIFGREGNFLSSWGAGQFKRAHGFKIVGDRAYVTDQADSVAMVYTLDGELVKQMVRADSIPTRVARTGTSSFASNTRVATKKSINITGSSTRARRRPRARRGQVTQSVRAAGQHSDTCCRENRTADLRGSGCRRTGRPARARR